MTNKELLAELKMAYKYLYDIRENGCQDHCNGQLSYVQTEELEVSLNNISRIFDGCYQMVMVPLDKLKKVDHKELIRNVRVDRDITGDYEIVLNNGASIYATCDDVGYKWYEDEDFITNDISEKEVFL